ncbi:MAG TPA: molybdopterin-dependent oxidoreductase [Acidimicrobiales bacterium]|nr:molybdopterin-dependent oxidoreductase [Acidimicrobiales bacterium]
MADPVPMADGDLSFTLDGRPATARKGELLIAAAERAGTYIPRFCYHPRMKPVGMCRMCLVEVSGPRGATLQPSCFVPVTDGMEVVTTSDKVKKAQDGVLEFLLVNHPLDCPVCDKGGECPLQDQTLAYGPGESRFVEEKRHFEKPVPISDLVLIDRERCIQCARCTRFAEEVAGEAQIDFAGRGDRVEVATFPGEPFSSYFSGNTVQICPVGALTATPYRFTARPWDLDQVESTCTTCAVGCRVAVQSSANRLTRLLGLDADPVNHGWLCDKGRFVFESVNGDAIGIDASPAGPVDVPAAVADRAVDVVPATASQVETLPVSRGQFAGEVKEAGVRQSRRLTEPMVRKEGQLVPVSWSEALAAAAGGLSSARAAGGPGAVALIGGARSTNEGAYAWAKLMKGVVGTDSVDAQLGDGLPADLVLSLPRATIDQACAAKTVVLLTGDVREELPVLFLRLREAVVDGGTNLLELTARPTALTRYAAVSLTTRPGDAPALARALVGRGDWPADDLSAARQLLGTAGDVSAETSVTAGEGIVVVLGRPSLAERAEVLAEAARVLADALPAARFLPALRRGNVFGALDMGLAPGLLPGRVSLTAGRDWFAGSWGAVPTTTGRDAAGILASLADAAGATAGMGQGARASEEPGVGAPGGSHNADRVRALVALGADLAGDFPDTQLATRALDAADFVVAVTGHHSPTVDHADVVLPAAVEHERPGTTTNLEGRVSRLGQKLVAPGLAWPDWMIAAELAVALGADLGVGSPADLWAEIENLAPAHAGLTAAVLDSPGARDGVLVPLSGSPLPAAVEATDPMAIPGVESVERQGAPPRVGLAVPPEVDDVAVPEPVGEGAGAPPSGDGAGAKPAVLAGLAGPAAAEPDPVHVPPVDSYSLRLVSSRRLYDDGVAVGGSPSLTPLVPAAVARANPYDLDRLGLTTGDPVRVRSARGSLVLAADADSTVPRGVVAVEFNLPTGGPGSAAAGAAGTEAAGQPVGNAAAALIDVTDVVTDVRLESVS